MGLAAGLLLRDCRLPGGAFCSSFDADSEGHEGKFYVWTREQVNAALGEDAALFRAHYGLDAAPNFEGQWHLHHMGTTTRFQQRTSDDWTAHAPRCWHCATSASGPDATTRC